jgi:carboxymethylenebutenolidase
MTTVSIPVSDGTALPAYVAEPTTPSATGVIVAHELFGVNPGIQRVTDDLAEAGYLAIAPEFYHRAAPAGRWMPTDEAGREEGFGYLHQLTRQQAIDDTAAGIAWLRSQPGIKRIAMIGFSAGGHLAYLAACTLDIDRTAVLYGGWLTVTDIPLSQPTPTVELTPGIGGRLLYLVGEDDFLISGVQRGFIGAALRAAGPGHSVESYPGVGHAFWWPGTAAFNQKARDDAWSRILAHLASLLLGRQAWLRARRSRLIASGNATGSGLTGNVYAPAEMAPGGAFKYLGPTYTSTGGSSWWFGQGVYTLTVG